MKTHDMLHRSSKSVKQSRQSAITQGVYKFNRTNLQEISRRFQEGFQEKSRTCLHCFSRLC